MTGVWYGKAKGSAGEACEANTPARAQQYRAEGRMEIRVTGRPRPRSRPCLLIIRRTGSGVCVSDCLFVSGKRKLRDGMSDRAVKMDGGAGSVGDRRSDGDAGDAETGWRRSWRSCRREAFRAHLDYDRTMRSIGPILVNIFLREYPNPPKIGDWPCYRLSGRSAGLWFCRIPGDLQMEKLEY